jgi:hypothetical protein
MAAGDFNVPDETRRLWVLCAGAGAGVVAFIAWFGGAIPAETCTGPPPAGVSSLLVYQFARTPADIEVVFGAEGDPCRQAMVTAMDRANTVDLFGFIATYGAFLAFFLVALLNEGAGTAARVGLVALAAAVVFDVVETATQLVITSALPGSATSLLLLTVASRGKFLGLAVACIGAGAAVFGRGGLLGRIVGVACIAGGALVLIGLAAPGTRAALSLGNAIAWLPMLVYAVAAAIGLRRRVTHP